MSTTNKLVFGSIVLIIVLAATFFGIRFFNKPAEVAEPAEEVPTEQVEEPENIEKTPEEEAQGNSEENTGTGNGEEPLPEGSFKIIPTIETTPYTAYLGFAKDIDGASEPAAEEVGEVVVGYEWEALVNSQLFASMVLPVFDPSDESAEYDIEVWNEESQSYEVLGNFPAGEEVDFPREGFAGATRFKVTGIDPALRICPGDRSFTWDARFTFEGELGLIRTPIIEPLLGGQTCRLR